MVAPYEIDAFQMWCPMTRAVMWPEDRSKELVSYNRIVDENSRGAYYPERFGTDCIGCKCMAWRWAEAPLTSTDEGERRGYCGFASQPSFPEVNRFEYPNDAWGDRKDANEVRHLLSELKKLPIEDQIQKLKGR